MKQKQLIGIFVVVAAAAAFAKFKLSQEEKLNYKGIKYYQVYSLNKPDTVFFCSEPVPVREKQVEERFSKEMYHFNYLRRRTNIIVKRVNYWFPVVEKILKKHGVPDDFKYLAVVESGLSNAVSPKGAAGFWQFIPSTARRMGLKVNKEVDERYDPIKSTHAACKYLKSAYKRLGNWTNVAAAYNMGITGIKRQMKVQRTDSYYHLKLNKETGRYVYKIIALKEILQNQEKYGFTKAKIGYPAHTKVKIKKTISDVNAFAADYEVSLQQLREFNPWLIGNSLTIDDKPYILKIPKHKRKHESETISEPSDEKVVLDSVQPTPFKKDSIKEAVERAEEAEKEELFIEASDKDTLEGS